NAEAAIWLELGAVNGLPVGAGSTCGRAKGHETSAKDARNRNVMATPPLSELPLASAERLHLNCDTPGATLTASCEHVEGQHTKANPRFQQEIPVDCKRTNVRRHSLERRDATGRVSSSFPFYFFLLFFSRIVAFREERKATLFCRSLKAIRHHR